MADVALRWSVPVDDRLHVIPCGPGAILGVACRSVIEADVEQTLDVWVHTIEDPRRVPDRTERVFTAVATGQPWPVGAQHHGVALTPPSIRATLADGVVGWTPAGVLVWHLLEVPRGL